MGNTVFNVRLGHVDQNLADGGDLHVDSPCCERKEKGNPPLPAVHGYAVLAYVGCAVLLSDVIIPYLSCFGQPVFYLHSGDRISELPGRREYGKIKSEVRNRLTNGKT
jgi:hypothetical protein